MTALTKKQRQACLAGANALKNQIDRYCWDAKAFKWPHKRFRKTAMRRYRALLKLSKASHAKRH